MADSEGQVSSSDRFVADPMHRDRAGTDGFEFNEAAAKEVFDAHEIVDLVGGAQDAIERHMAEDFVPGAITEITEMFSHSPPPEPAPEPGVVELEPGVMELEVGAVPELWAAPQGDATKAVTKEEVTPDSTTAPPPVEPTESAVEPEAEAEPESAYVEATEPEPQVALVTPEPISFPPAEPRTAAASAPAERVKLPTAPPTRAEEKPPSPAPASLVDLLYWRDVKTTGVVFGAALLLLLSLTMCSIVSVSSYVGLALLSVTICFRIYKGILQAIQKSDEGHPFKLYLDQEVALSEDMVHKYSDMVLAKINKTMVELRRLFLVEDLVDSVKFAVLMWILTYVGALFNGLTLIILGLIGAFSCPIIYEKHQAQIDHYLGIVNKQIKDVVGKIQAKVPGIKRKAE